MYGSDEVIGYIRLMEKLVVISNCMTVDKKKSKSSKCTFLWKKT